MSILKNIARLDEASSVQSSTLTYDECLSICANSMEEASKLKTLMNIAIVDAAGNLLFFFKMPGAWEGSVDIAQSKAYTAFAFSGNKDQQGPLSTEELGKLSQPGKPLFGIQNTNQDKGIVIFGGGVPLYKGNVLVGALGISGSSVENDIKVSNRGSKGFN